MRKLTSCVGVLFLIVAAGCGSSGNPAPSAPPPAVGNGSGGTRPGTQGVVITIPVGAATLGTSAFQPNPVSVQPGMTVTWMNQDSMTHTATSDVGRFDSGNIAPGQSFSWTVPQGTGTSQIDYHCKIHPSMRGSLTLGSGAGTSGGGAVPSMGGGGY